MKNVTLTELNGNDNPRDFNGELIIDDGVNELWKFGEKFANRTETEAGYFWDDDLKGWNPENYEIKTLDN
jgi:hypothetical protein